MRKSGCGAAVRKKNNRQSLFWFLSIGDVKALALLRGGGAHVDVRQSPHRCQDREVRDGIAPQAEPLQSCAQEATVGPKRGTEAVPDQGSHSAGQRPLVARARRSEVLEGGWCLFCTPQIPTTPTLAHRSCLAQLTPTTLVRRCGIDFNGLKWVEGRSYGGMRQRKGPEYPPRLRAWGELEGNTPVKRNAMTNGMRKTCICSMVRLVAQEGHLSSRSLSTTG